MNKKFSRNGKINARQEKRRHASVIYTAPSGTQTIEIAGLLLDENVGEDIAKLKAIYQRQRNRSAPRGSSF